MAEGFAGGFAQGYAQTSAGVRQAITLRDQLGLQKQEFEFRKEQSGVQQKQFSEDIQLRSRALDLQQRQQEAVIEHQKYTDKLQQQEIDIKLKLQDSAEIEQINKLLDIGIKGDPKTFANMMKIYQLQKGIDPKSEKAQAIAKLITDLPVQNLEDVKAFIGDMYGKGLDPGTVQVLIKRFLTDPTAFMDFTKSFMSSAASKAQESAPVLVADQNAPYGSRYATREQAATGAPTTGLAGPPRANVLSPNEIVSSEAAKGNVASAQKYADDAYSAADFAKGIVPFSEGIRIAAQTGKFTTGFAGGARYNFGRLLEFVGVNPAEFDKKFPGLDLSKAIGDPSQAEAINMMSSFIGQELSKSLSRITDMQVRYIQAAVPGLLKTPEGNIIFADLMDRFAHRADQVQDLYNKYEDPNGPHKGDFRGFKEEKQALDRKDPIINEDLFKRISGQLDKTPGAGLNLPGAAEAASAAAGKKFLDIPDVGKFPISAQRTKDSLAVIETGQGNVPFVETDADLKFLKPGEIFYYGPKKQMARMPAEGTAPKGPVSPKSVVRIR